MRLPPAFQEPTYVSQHDLDGPWFWPGDALRYGGNSATSSPLMQTAHRFRWRIPAKETPATIKKAEHRSRSVTVLRCKRLPALGGRGPAPFIRLRAAHAISTIVAEIAITVSNGDCTTIITGRCITLEASELIVSRLDAFLLENHHACPIQNLRSGLAVRAIAGGACVSIGARRS